MNIRIHQDHIAVSKELKWKIDTFLELVQTDINFIKDLSGYLRNIYCDKSGTKSFLYRVTSKNNFYIMVNVFLSSKEKKELWFLPKDFPEPLFEQLNSSVVWLWNSPAPFKKLSIFDAILNEHELYLWGQYYNYKSFIEIIADKFDAHLDEKIKISDINIFWGWMEIWWMSPVYRWLYDLSKTTAKLLDEIIHFLETKEESDFIKLK